MGKLEQEILVKDLKAQSAGGRPWEAHHEVKRAKQRLNSSQISKILF